MSCFGTLDLPYQSARPGIYAHGTAEWWPAGAIAYLDFVNGRYMIDGRTYTNPAVAVTGVTDQWPEILANPAGMNSLYVDAAVRLPAGTFDVLRIQPDAAVWTTEETSGCGQLIESATEIPFIQQLGVFPAGLLTQAEKDALAVPAPVYYATTETDAETYLISPFEELTCKTDNNSVTVTLPLNPVSGQDCMIIRTGSNSVVVQRNGQTLTAERIADDWEIDMDNTMHEFKFRDGTWRVNMEEMS